MSRSKWKGPYTDTKSLKALEESKKSYKKLKASRKATIVPKFSEQSVKVHNGKKFVELLITEDMIGHKFGEFSSTRKRFSFKKAKTKK